MSFISEIKPTVQPINDVSWERREFPSPDRLWFAVFHDCYEWHMGAPGWQLSVVSSKSGLAISNSELAKLSEDKGLICPLDYSPWSVDSKILALRFWDSGLVFFDPLLNICKVKSDLFPHAIQWSPTSNYLLVFLHNSQFAILDDTGNILTKIDWKSTEHELPRIGWLASGEVFFVIGRTSNRAKSRITFFNAENGAMVSNELLDPAKLVPYNESEYKSIPRGGYSLVLSPSSRSVGSLLDTWNDMVYDQEKGTLALSTYRPISKVFELNGYPACEVKKKWVSIKMNG